MTAGGTCEPRPGPSPGRVHGLAGIAMTRSGQVLFFVASPIGWPSRRRWKPGPTSTGSRRPLRRAVAERRLLSSAVWFLCADRDAEVTSPARTAAYGRVKRSRSTRLGTRSTTLFLVLSNRLGRWGHLASGVALPSMGGPPPISMPRTSRFRLHPLRGHDPQNRRRMRSPRTVDAWHSWPTSRPVPPDPSPTRWSTGISRSPRRSG